MFSCSMGLRSACEVGWDALLDVFCLGGQADVDHPALALALAH